MKTYLKFVGWSVGVIVAIAMVIAAEKFFSSDSRAAPTEGTRPIRETAVAFLQQAASASTFISNVTGKPQDIDATSVRLRGNSSTSLKSSDNGGCLATFASGEAVLAQGANKGYGWIPVDWGKVTEIDDRFSESERGLLVRGGVSNNLGPKLALRIIASFSSLGAEWAYHAKQLQRACGSG